MEEADVTKVDKLTTETMMWMNSAMNQQSKQSLTADPVVKVKEIRAKTRVSVYVAPSSATKRPRLELADIGKRINRSS